MTHTTKEQRDELRKLAADKPFWPWVAILALLDEIEGAEKGHEALAASLEVLRLGTEIGGHKHTVLTKAAAILRGLPIPAATTIGAPWEVERHDQDDGSISYEIWDHSPAGYRRIVTINDSMDEYGRYAKGDADRIVNAIYAAPAPAVVTEKWRPIETAPRDREPMRLKCSDGKERIGWVYEKSLFETEAGGYVIDGSKSKTEVAVTATHWAPLPPMATEKMQPIRFIRAPYATLEQLDFVRKSPLYQIGDVILVWVNEGDFWLNHPIDQAALSHKGGGNGE